MMVMSVSFFNFVWVTFTPFPCLELLPCLLIRMTASEAPRTWPSPSPFSYFFLTAHRTPHSRPSSASDLLSFLHLDGVHQNVAIRLVHRQASLNRVGIVVAVPHCPPRTRPFRHFGPHHVLARLQHLAHGDNVLHWKVPVSLHCFSCTAPVAGFTVTGGACCQ
jgi:hypothetical protein